VEALMQSPGDVVLDAVRQALGEVHPRSPQKLAGGAMHESWGAASDDGDLVIRVSPAGRDDREKTRQEYGALVVAHRHGVLVPKPLYVGETPGGQTFMVMERIAGDSNPRQLLTGAGFEEARAKVPADLARELAAIHRIPAAEVSDLGLHHAAPGEDALQHEWQRLEDQFRDVALNPYPAVEFALRWVRRNIATLAPQPRPLHLVHGDFRIGNMMYDEAGLTGILDWEGVHVGEAEFDITWLCTRVWRFGQNAKEAGGLCTREEFVRLYEEASGFAIDRRRLAVWEVLQNVRWCNITMMQAKYHLDGSIPSHELAAIGRRTADTELEFLRLIDPGRATHAG
jgi:aminoglycoside phosphotransferase (APT) family kinase protein